VFTNIAVKVVQRHYASLSRYLARGKRMSSEPPSALSSTKVDGIKLSKYPIVLL